MIISTSIHGVTEFKLGEISQKDGFTWRELKVEAKEGIFTLTLFGLPEDLELKPEEE